MFSCNSCFCFKNKVTETLKYDKSILVVDDDRDILITIEAFLQDYAFNVKTFTDASLALKHFQYCDCYDLVVSDVMMPKMTGFEFVRKIKELSPSVRVLLMSASEIDNSELSKVLSSIKVDGFIQKPISQEQFIKIIENQGSILQEEEEKEKDDDNDK